MASESTAMRKVAYTSCNASKTEMLPSFCVRSYVEAVVRFAPMKEERERVADVDVFNFVRTQSHLLRAGSENGSQDIKDRGEDRTWREALM